MNREDIIRIAKDNGFDLLGPDSYCRMEYWTAITAELERFFQAAYDAGVAAEREACAELCELREDFMGEHADRIRARGQ